MLLAPASRPGLNTAPTRRWLPIALAVGVAVVAFAGRLTLMLRGGGLAGSDGYDDSVYYAAATALIHGELPYRDYVLLHPPGFILALTPFTALAQLLTDRIGQDIARLSFMALGALNSVLVLRLGNRFSLVAGLVAGLVYALFYPALYTERTTTLEALGNTTLLVALILLVRPRRMPDPSAYRWPLVMAGVALGFGTTVKIWGVVALAVIAIWLALTLGRRAAAWLLGPAAATVIAICLPFFLAAPNAMWRMVVVDQLGRPRSSSSLTSRLSTMVGLKVAWPDPPELVVVITLTVLTVILLAASAVAIRTLGARVVVTLMAVHAAMLLAGPNLYLHYVTVVAAPGAVVLGIGAGAGWQWLRARGHRGAAWAALLSSVVAVAAYGAPGIERGKGKPLHIDLATAAATTPGCITADDPTYLIAMNVLSRNYRQGCPVWIDPTGIAIDRAGPHTDEPYASTSNPVWQQLVMDHLLSGDGTMVARAATQLDRANKARIQQLPVIVERQGFALRRVR